MRNMILTAIKNNRLIALTLEDKHQGHFVRVDELELSDKQSIHGYLRGYDKEISLVRRIFTNKDGKLKSFISHSNIMSIWLNHLLKQYAHKVIISSYPYSLFLNLNA